jgi:hypothetical protein
MLTIEFIIKSMGNQLKILGVIKYMYIKFKFNYIKIF